MNRRSTLGGALAGLLAARPGAAGRPALAQAAHPRYHLTELGLLPGGGTNPAYAINASGQVVGEALTANGESHAFLWDRGALVDLGTLGGRLSFAADLNASGHVVGASTTDGQQVLGREPGGKAFLYRDGVMRPLAPDAPSSLATHVNDAGQVVGYVMTAGGHLHACLWDRGAILDLGTLGGRHSTATAINASGQVVGWAQTAGDAVVRPFLWENGVMADLGAPPGVQGSAEARAINDAGQVVVRTTAGGQAPEGRSARLRSFLWHKGAWTDLGALPEFPHITAEAINNAGQVVGVARRGPGQRRAFIWEKGVLASLADLIPADLAAPDCPAPASGPAAPGCAGWLVEYVGGPFGGGINDAGQIVGHGTRDGHRQRGFLLTPAHPPA